MEVAHSSLWLFLVTLGDQIALRVKGHLLPSLAAAVLEERAGGPPCPLSLRPQGRGSFSLHSVLSLSRIKERS